MTARSLAALAGGALLTVTGTAPATTFIVNQVGFTWSPSSVTIDPGDTVQWVHSAGSHTVTSGTGPTDPNAGLLFNKSPFNSGTFQFTFNTPGTYPFFCSPHFAFGMTGVVNVNQPTSAGGAGVESATWSRIKNLYR